MAAQTAFARRGMATPCLVARILTLLLFGASLCQGQQIFFNANFYTVDTSTPTAEAIAVSSTGVIEAVGNLATISSAYPTYTRVDLGGRFVLPGFIDSHLHAVEAGINSQICFVAPNAGVEDLPFFFSDPGCPDGGMFGNAGWIMGAGIDLSNLIAEIDAGSRTPAQVLDEVYPTTPVLILDAFGHGAVANTRAMLIAGYNVATPDPPGGQLLRDSSNNLIGIVTENAQQRLRNRAFPNNAANQAVAYNSLLSAVNTLIQNGITTVSDAGGFWKQAQTEAWGQAEFRGDLKIRAYNALYIYPDIPIETQIPMLNTRRIRDPTRLVNFNQAKIYVDGILSLSTGLISSPYNTDPFARYRTTSTGPWQGFEYFGDAATLNNVCSTLVNNGWQLHLHVAGDVGATRALNCITATGNPPANQPHRLTHNFLLTAADRNRFAPLNVFADFQVAPSTIATGNINLMIDRIGRTLTSEFIPLLETFNAGAQDHIVLTSDWDADVLSPLVKIQTVLTRPDGRNLPNVAEAIKMFTINPARLLKDENRIGSISVGKFADLVVLDRDITSIPVSTIGNTQVIRTYLAGRQIFPEVGPTTAPVSPAPTPSSPTPSPTQPPQPSPTAMPTGAPTCFSEVSTVDVLGKGLVSMKDLKVNDKVFTGTTGHGTSYQSVYAFGHHSQSPTEYVQILTNLSQSLPLEISPAHLLYLADKASPVRADSIQEGDILLHRPKQGPEQNATVVDVRTIYRNGAYMPLVKDGALVVNGLYASSYVSIADDAPSIVQKYKHILSEDTLLHWWLAPYRMVCLWISPTLCENDYNEEGIAYWLVWGRDLAKYGEEWNGCFQILGLVVVTLFMAIGMVLESLVRCSVNPMFWVSCSLFAVFAVCWVACSFALRAVLQQAQVAARKKAD